MKNWMKWALVFLVSTGFGYAGTIKVWANNQVLTAADLNANFAHIHSLMVGGHGARLVDADVAASANIAQSKIANAGRIPDAIGTITTNCNSATTTTCLGTFDGMVIETLSSSGSWFVSLDASTLTSALNIQVTCAQDNCFCNVSTRGGAPPEATIKCRQHDGTAITSTQFSVVVWSP